MDFKNLQTSSPIIVKPSNKTSFTSGEQIRFVLPRCNIDCSTIRVLADVSADNALCSFSETIGSGGLISAVTVRMGGQQVENTTNYGSLLSNILTSHTSYGSGSAIHAGTSELFGLGGGLGNGAANSVVYQIPLLTCLSTFKLDMRQFVANTEIILDLANDDVALFDTTGPSGTGVYAIHNIYIEFYDCRPDELNKLHNGSILNVTSYNNTSVVATTTGNILFPLQCTNATRILINANEDVSGYVATDNKFRSNANLTNMSVRLQGRNWPDLPIGSQNDFVTEAYSISQAALFPTRNFNHIHSDYISVSDFRSATTRFGFITLPLFGRMPKRNICQNHVNGYLLGTPITSGDALIYTQAAATGDNFNVFLQFTRRLLYNAGALTVVDLW